MVVINDLLDHLSDIAVSGLTVLHFVVCPHLGPEGSDDGVFVECIELLGSVVLFNWIVQFWYQKNMAVTAHLDMSRGKKGGGGK